MMVKLRTRLALSMLHIADFYLDRTHWQSAAARYRRVLDEYPGLGLDARALYRLGVCLENMRREDEALRLYHVVVENYSDHPPPGMRRARIARAGIARTSSRKSRLEAGRDRHHAPPFLLAALDGSRARCNLPGVRRVDRWASGGIAMDIYDYSSPTASSEPAARPAQSESPSLAQTTHAATADGSERRRPNPGRQTRPARLRGERPRNPAAGSPRLRSRARMHRPSRASIG